jgi:hypothetical protein
MIADTPSAAPAMCTKAPVSTPNTAARPPARPWATLCETM